MGSVSIARCTDKLWDIPVPQIHQAHWELLSNISEQIALPLCPSPLPSLFLLLTLFSSLLVSLIYGGTRSSQQQKNAHKNRNQITQSEGAQIGMEQCSTRLYMSSACSAGNQSIADQKCTVSSSSGRVKKEKKNQKEKRSCVGFFGSTWTALRLTSKTWAQWKLNKWDTWAQWKLNKCSMWMGSWVNNPRF